MILNAWDTMLLYLYLGHTSCQVLKGVMVSVDKARQHNVVCHVQDLVCLGVFLGQIFHWPHPGNALAGDMDCCIAELPLLLVKGQQGANVLCIRTMT